MFHDPETEASALKLDVLRSIMQEKHFSSIYSSNQGQRFTRSMALAYALHTHLSDSSFGCLSVGSNLLCKEINPLSPIDLGQAILPPHTGDGKMLHRASCMPFSRELVTQHPYHFKIDNKGYLMMRIGEQLEQDPNQISDQVQSGQCKMFSTVPLIRVKILNPLMPILRVGNGDRKRGRPPSTSKSAWVHGHSMVCASFHYPKLRDLEENFMGRHISGQFVSMHLCHNRECFNPFHIVYGGRINNMNMLYLPLLHNVNNPFDVSSLPEVASPEYYRLVHEAAKEVLLDELNREGKLKGTKASKLFTKDRMGCLSRAKEILDHHYSMCSIHPST